MDRFRETSATRSAERAIAAGREAFGSHWAPDHVAIAPGRIELLGNHIDYSGGPVLAAAIDRFVAIAAKRESTDSSSSTLAAIAADAPTEFAQRFNASNVADWRNPSQPPQPFDYVRGVLAALGTRPALTPRLPASIAIAGDVPIGFGVSSSAALCVSLSLALADGFERAEDLVLLAQEAEHRAGTPCGTMDQSASVAGGVIAFDGATLSTERLSPSLGDLAFAVIDSGVARSLGTSSYPKRVAESRDALLRARRALGIDLPHLAALTTDQLADLDSRGVLPEPLSRRARHVVEETQRVHEGRCAIADSDWTRFGQLMTASGRSSATLYEISHPIVEELVSEVLKFDGVLGARMMGGGEGGTALALLPRDAVPQLEAALRSSFYRRRGMAARNGLVHVCAFAPGAVRVSVAEVVSDAT